LLRKIELCVLIMVCISVMGALGASAADEEERRGEIGVQIGVRRADSDIVSDGDSGVALTWGVEGAWAFNHKWAIFLDANTSEHDSKEFCVENPNCNALTPVSHHKVVTFGMERRLNAGPKGGQWVFGLGTGMMDVEWNGAQIHHGILSFNAGRRSPLGPGVLRWTLRVETAFSGRTDAQFYGALDSARLTNVVFVVGWGFDFGGRFVAPPPASGGPDAISTSTAAHPGR
jgi:hypothetical protein